MSTTLQKIDDLKRIDSEADVLAEQIRFHNDKYWVEHKPEIADTEYDKLIERLRAIDPDNPVLIELVEDEAQDRAAFPKVKHDIPMLSIEKKFAVEDVIKWATDAGAFNSDGPEDGLLASYKVDGSSCSLIYENGKLVRAASRGTGSLGDDITRNAKTIADIPQTVPAMKGKVEVRGEIYMSIASFMQALKRFEEELAAGDADENDRPTNPRNYCAGSLKQKDANITRERNLSFMAHGCFGKLPGSDGKSETSNLKVLADLGFKTAFYMHVRNAVEVSQAVSGIESGRKALSYEIDGVVFSINRLSLHQELGSTSHHPKYRLAFKFSRERGETVVKAIIWNTTRSGRVHPTMVVEPISLGGAMVTLCTLHNAKTVKATGLRIGDRVLMEREVIPYFVQKISEESQSAELPTQCLACDFPLSWDETETNLVCKNTLACPAQLRDYLCYYVSRRVTNMVGVGERLIGKLLESGLLKSPPDFYTLTEDQIRAEVERQGETSARNIIKAIRDRHEQTLETFLVSLGIRGLGPAVAARLANHFHTLEAVRGADAAAFMNIEGIAETLAATIHEGLQERQPLIDELLKHITLKQTEKIDGVLDGKSFCLTGHVEFDYAGTHYDARPEIEKLIKSKGGTIKNVSKTLDFLVVGDEAGSKVEKAKKAGVTILDAAELNKMLG